jgi:hypothetical protein
MFSYFLPHVETANNFVKTRNSFEWWTVQGPLNWETLHAHLFAFAKQKNSTQVSPQLLQFKQLHQHFVNKFALKKQKSILKNGSSQTRLDRLLSLIIRMRRKTLQKVWFSFSINFVMIHIESSLMTANTVKLQQTSHQLHLRNTLQAWSPPVSWALNSA